MNYPLIDVASRQLRLEGHVFQSKLCRYLVILLWIRVPIIQLIISSCQYATILSISLLVVFEGSRLSCSLYAYLSFRHYKHILLLIIDASQSLSLLAFFVTILLSAHLRSDETAPAPAQSAAIWLIVVSCFVEYSLMFVYVALQLFSFVRFRIFLKNNHFAAPANQPIVYIRYTKALTDKTPNPIEEPVQQSKLCPSSTIHNKRSTIRPGKRKRVHK